MPEESTLKPTLQREIRELESRKVAASVELDGVMGAINSGKRERAELEQDISLIQRRAQGESRLADEYQVRRVANETSLDEQHETMRGQTTEIAAREALVTALKREEVEYDAKSVVRDAKERTRLDTVLLEENTKVLEIRKTRAKEEKEVLRLRADYEKTVDDYQALVQNETTARNRITSLEKEDEVVTSQLESMRTQRKQYEDQTTALQGQKTVLEEDIKTLNAEIREKTKAKGDLELERQESQRLTDEKKVELDGITKSVFIIAERERKVNQKEAYIKDLYAKAGINY